jgi:hypothetical protein
MNQTTNSSKLADSSAFFIDKISQEANPIDDAVEFHLKNNSGGVEFFYNNIKHVLSYDKSDGTFKLYAQKGNDFVVIDSMVQINNKNTPDGTIELGGLTNSTSQRVYITRSPTNPDKIIAFSADSSITTIPKNLSGASNIFLQPKSDQAVITRTSTSTSPTTSNLTFAPEGKGVFQAEISDTSQGTVSAKFNLTGRIAAYANEVGYFSVDDMTGRIGNLRPGDAGYAAAALDPSRAKTIFAGDVRTNGSTSTSTLPSNGLVGFYLIQNSSIANWRANNPSNALPKTAVPFNSSNVKAPVAFFSFQNANPDNFDHLKTSFTADGKLTLLWEDLTNGGDKDYNDVMFTAVGFRSPTTTKVSLPKPIDCPVYNCNDKPTAREPEPPFVPRVREPEPPFVPRVREETPFVPRVREEPPFVPRVREETPFVPKVKEPKVYEPKEPKVYEPKEPKVYEPKEPKVREPEPPFVPRVREPEPPFVPRVREPETPFVPRVREETPFVPRVREETPFVPRVREETPFVPRVREPETPFVPRVREETPFVPRAREPETPFVPRAREPETPFVPRAREPETPFVPRARPEDPVFVRKPIDEPLPFLPDGDYSVKGGIIYNTNGEQVKEGNSYANGNYRVESGQAFRKSEIDEKTVLLPVQKLRERYLINLEYKDADGNTVSEKVSYDFLISLGISHDQIKLPRLSNELAPESFTVIDKNVGTSEPARLVTLDGEIIARTKLDTGEYIMMDKTIYKAFQSEGQSYYLPIVSAFNGQFLTETSGIIVNSDGQKSSINVDYTLLASLGIAPEKINLPVLFSSKNISSQYTGALSFVQPENKNYYIVSVGDNIVGKTYQEPADFTGSETTMV